MTSPPEGGERGARGAVRLLVLIVGALLVAALVVAVLVMIDRFVVGPLMNVIVL